MKNKNRVWAAILSGKNNRIELHFCFNLLGKPIAVLRNSLAKNYGQFQPLRSRIPSMCAK